MDSGHKRARNPPRVSLQTSLDDSKRPVDHYFTDGSPYWEVAEETSPAEVVENDTYQEALLHFSATHRPSVDQSFHGTPVLVNRSGSRSPEKPVPSRVLVPSTSTTPPAETQPSDNPSFALPPQVPPNVDRHTEGTTSTGGYRDKPAPGESVQVLYDNQQFPSSLEDDWEEANRKPVMGRILRELPSDDTGDVLVDVSAHRHYGHVSALKVRPTVGIDHFILPTRQGHLPISKIGPAYQLPAFHYPDAMLGLPTAIRSASATPNSYAIDESGGEIILYPLPHHTRGQVPHSPQLHHTGVDIPPKQTEGHPLGSSDSVDFPLVSVRGARDRKAAGSDSWDQDLEQAAPSHHLLSENISGGHGHVDKPRPALPDSYSILPKSGLTPTGDSEHILFPEPLSRSMGFLSSVHLGHSDVSKVQQCTDVVILSGPLSGYTSAREDLSSDRGSNLRKVQSAAFSSGLAEYWKPSYPLSSSFRWSPGWLRSLIRGAPESTYKTRFTELPNRKPSQTRSGPRTPRALINDASVENPLDAKVKETVSTLGLLLDEATLLANEVLDHSYDRRQANSELAEVHHFADAHRLPSVHGSVLDEIEPGGDELEAGWASSAARRSEHPHSVPGTQSSNIVRTILKRTSSFLKSKLGARYWLGGAHRHRPREPHSYGMAPDHLQSDRHLPTPRYGEVEQEAREEYPTRLGCLTGGKIARKIRSCHMPRIQHRSSFLHSMVDGPSAATDRLWEGEAAAEYGAWLGPVESRTRKSPSWSFDGANSEADDWPAENEDYHHHSDSESPLEMHRRPHPTQQGAHSEPEQDNKARNRGGRFSLRGRSHVSLRGYQGLNLARAYRRQPIARDWSIGRKRFVATVACLSTAVIGTLIGIYAGLVPSIQYWIADLKHYAIRGNVFFYLGLAIPTFFFWPLPLLHGRKPYILSSLVIAMPLLFPQAISVSEMRSPYASTWR